MYMRIHFSCYLRYSSDISRSGQGYDQDHCISDAGVFEHHFLGGVTKENGLAGGPLFPYRLWIQFDDFEGNVGKFCRPGYISSIHSITNDD